MTAHDEAGPTEGGPTEGKPLNAGSPNPAPSNAAPPNAGPPAAKPPVAVPPNPGLPNAGLPTGRPPTDTPPAAGHNGGPPLQDDPDAAWRLWCWRRAHKRAWPAPREVALRRLARAEELGLTYRQYTLEILERGRYL